MKNLKLMGFLMIFASSLMFIQCTTDVVVGPAGADGTNGIDGTNGVNGVDGINGADGVDGVGTASCVACHSDTHRDPIDASYKLSGHAAGGAVGYAGSRDSCSECHSNEGHINYLTGVEPVDIENPTPISCTTCHDKHGTFDFENDGFDYALRNFDPVPLRKVDSSYVIDYGDKSNVCITCHQPRKAFSLDTDGDGLIEVPNRYGPHYGAQSILLEGIHGVEIPGSVAYPSPVSSTHRNSASCVSCHMGESDGEDGQHSWLPTLNSCTSCHGDPETLVTNLQTEIDGLMAELEVLFTAEGLLDAEGGLVHSVDYPEAVANAYWNYRFIYYDHSKGVHNPAYTRALLKNSIEALQ